MSPARTPDTSAAGRLQRLLALVPWVLDHPGATVDEVCERFEMTREMLIADVELLYVTGVPPYGPGDLMEAWVDGDKVHIGFDDWFARYHRLTWREAAGLNMAGRAQDAQGLSKPCSGFNVVSQVFSHAPQGADDLGRDLLGPTGAAKDSDRFLQKRAGADGLTLQARGDPQPV